MAANNNSKKGGKKPPQKKTQTKPAPKKETMVKSSAEEHNANRRQRYSVLMFAAAIFLLFVTLVPSGVAEGDWNFWQGMRDFFFGLFGVCAFAWPLMLLYTAFVFAKDRPLSNLGIQLGGIAGFIVCLSSLIHIFSNLAEYLSAEDIVDQMKYSWSIGLSVENGGVFGALVGGCFTKMFGKTGAVITILIILFSLFMFLTGTTLLRLISVVRTPVEKSGEQSREDIEAKEAKREERAARQEEKQRIRKEKKEREEQERLERERQRKTPYDKGYDDRTAEPEPVAVKQPQPQPKPQVQERAVPQSFFDDGFDPVPEKSGGTAAAVLTGIPGIDNLPPRPDTDTLTPTAEIVTQTEPADDESLLEIIDKANAASKKVKSAEKKTDGEKTVRSIRKYVLPGLDCLKIGKSNTASDYKEELTANAKKLTDTLHDFGIETKIVDISRGPSVTRYEIQPAPGVKISRIAGLSDDLAMNLAASGVRIEAPIPNKAAVGIEVPNRNRATVTLREIIATPQFSTAKSKLNVALGRDITGNAICTDLAKMPHLLIAGTTGSGKSVCLNSMIVSILYNASPDEVKLLMIDPKQVEFTVYNGIPHLIVPVVSDPRKASGALAWAVSEMLKRYKLFSEKNVRDISGYNKAIEKLPDFEPMYHIVIFIDELSDLMMAAPNEVEDSICRLAQMARAAGMHLVIATQRPSVNVITGIIKANIPSRIALSVSSQVDSRTILDMAGAEKLLGYGDMLFNPVGMSKPIRVQGCFLSDEEVESVVDFIKAQETSSYDDSVMQEIEENAAVEKKKGSSQRSDSSFSNDGSDEEFPRAVAVVVENQIASTTLLQRKLKIGYAKAARIMDDLMEHGIIGPSEGSKPRKVLLSKQAYLEMNAMRDGAFDAVDDEDDE